MATIIGEGEACGRYLPGLPARRCAGTSFEFRTSSYTERDGAKSWRQYQASRKCRACGQSSCVDVAPEVPRVITTAESWAGWWAKIDARPA